MNTNTIIITGASAGIGAEAARALSRKGWRVGVLGRNPQRTQTLAKEIGARPYMADFASLREVQQVAWQLLEDFPRVDVLAHNAGGLFSRQPFTQDGHEITFQVNHLAPFLLTQLMLDRLLESRSKVIVTSSVGHHTIGRFFNINNLDMKARGTAHLAYGNSKLANILFVRELHRRYGGQGLSAAAFHPGVVATSFARDTRSPMRALYTSRVFKRLLRLKTAQEGADTLLWLAQGTPGKDWQPGGYYAQRKPASISAKARSDTLALALWQKSEAMCQAFMNRSPAEERGAPNENQVAVQ